MRLALTGASGHVGAVVSRLLLSRGDRVRLIVHRDTRALEGLAAERVTADLTEPDTLLRAFRDAEVVYHLAASITLDRRHGEVMRRVNVEGTRNVIRACRACGVKRLVHFSSIEALRDLNPARPTDESNPLAGAPDTTLYGWTKAQGERLVLQAAAEGLSAVIICPTAIIGPHDCKPSHLGRSLLDLYHGRLPALIKGGFNWVDVRDVAEGALRAEQGPAPGQRYILSGTWMSLPDLAVLVGTVTGRRIRRPAVPLGLARAVSRLAGGLPLFSARFPGFTPDALLAVGKHRLVSGRKARHELGYRPRPLTDTVRDTFAWFADRGWLDDGAGDTAPKE